MFSFFCITETSAVLYSVTYHISWLNTYNVTLCRLQRCSPRGRSMIQLLREQKNESVVRPGWFGVEVLSWSGVVILYPKGTQVTSSNQFPMYEPELQTFLSAVTKSEPHSMRAAAWIRQERRDRSNGTFVGNDAVRTSIDDGRYKLAPT